MDVILTEHDLKDIMEDTYEVISKWEVFGVQLGILQSRIDVISKDEREQVCCYQRMLYDCLKRGNCTWRGIIKALCTKTVGEDELARKLERKYRSTRKLQRKYRSTDNLKQMKIVGYLEGYKGKLKESTSIGSDSADESGSSLEVDAIATPSVSASGSRRFRKRKSDGGASSGQKKKRRIVDRVEECENKLEIYGDQLVKLEESLEDSLQANKRQALMITNQNKKIARQSRRISVLERARSQ